MKKKELALSKVYKLLEPGPVVLMTTCYKDEIDVMAMSWTMPIEFEPPMFACIVSNRNHSFDLLKKSKECVINIPQEKMLDRVVKIGNVSGKKVDKFQKFNLLTEKAQTVKAPLLSECFANLESKVIDMRFVEKYGMFVLQVHKAWTGAGKRKFKVFHHHGEGVFAVDGKIIRIASAKK